LDQVFTSRNQKKIRMASIWIAAAMCLALCVNSAVGSTIGEHSAGSGFCYRDDEGCGPSTAEWAELCHTGTRQSPVDLPPLDLNLGTLTLRLNHYKGTSFRLQNNGHSLAFDFAGASKSSMDASETFPFPDPLSVNHLLNKGVINYKLGGGHFHWGTNDTSGSEHCVGTKCYAMELHLVHYMANYSSQAEAVASGNPNALTVLGIFIDSRPGLLANFTGTAALAPIVKHLKEVEVANHDEWTTINEPLDLTRLTAPLLVAPQVYSYKGSLTTPGCNEQVNWFVIKNPATISPADVQAFRSILKDSRSETLSENHRPVQKLNGRTIYLSRAFAY